jgi:TatD DNase family protein
MLIDSHCHLDFPPFDCDRDAVIQRAKEAGISYFINIGSTIESSIASCALAQKYTQVYACVGVHPHDADTFNQEAENKLKELAQQSKVVAIGEIGLDYYRNLSSVDNQKKAFIKQITLAKELKLPLVIHSRSADNDVIEILKSAMPLHAVIHCFSSDENFLQACLKMGFFISFTCNITYKKAQNLRDIVKLVPLNRLMLETDAPYLSPEGFRGKRNEPFQIKLLAQEISRIKDVSFADIATRTTQNAKEFFKLE